MLCFSFWLKKKLSAPILRKKKVGSLLNKDTVFYLLSPSCPGGMATHFKPGESDKTRDKGEHQTSENITGE